MFQKIIKILLIVVWMGIIFMLSNDNSKASNSKSNTIILEIYKIFDNRELTKSEEKAITKRFAYPVRKLAHFTEYLILGLLGISLISEFITLDKDTFYLIILFYFLLAGIDEFHQIFVAGRSPKLVDVFIDTFGSSVGCLIYLCLRRKFYVKAK